MIKSNFLKKVHSAATFLQNSNDLGAKLEPLKNDFWKRFQKSVLQSVYILAIVSHPHLLMGFNYLLSTAPRNKTIIAQLPKINTCFWDFQNHAKNGDNVPLSPWKKNKNKLINLIPMY